MNGLFDFNVEDADDVGGAPKPRERARRRPAAERDQPSPGQPAGRSNRGGTDLVPRAQAARGDVFIGLGLHLCVVLEVHELFVVGLDTVTGDDVQVSSNELMLWKAASYFV